MKSPAARLNDRRSPLGQLLGALHQWSLNKTTGAYVLCSRTLRQWPCPNLRTGTDRLTGRQTDRQTDKGQFVHRHGVVHTWFSLSRYWILRSG